MLFFEFGYFTDRTHFDFYKLWENEKHSEKSGKRPVSSEGFSPGLSTWLI